MQNVGGGGDSLGEPAVAVWGGSAGKVLACGGEPVSFTVRALAIGEYPAKFRTQALIRTPFTQYFGHVVRALDGGPKGNGYEVSRHATHLAVTVLPPEPALAAPANPRIETDGDAVRFRWDAVAGAVGYHLQWRVGSQGYGDYNRTRTETGTSYPSEDGAVRGIDADARVEMQVRAYSNEAISAWSEAMRDGTAVVPGAVGGLAAESAESRTAIRVRWDAPGDDGGSAVTGYRIDVSEYRDANWTVLKENTGSSATQYVHTGLAPGDVRFYRVSAINAQGTGPAGAVVRGMTAEPASAPQDLGGTVQGARAIGLAWSAPSDDGGTAVTGYRLETCARECADNGNWSLLAEVPVPESGRPGYRHEGLEPESGHRYRVSAESAAGVARSRRRFFTLLTRCRWSRSRTSRQGRAATAPVPS